MLHFYPSNHTEHLATVIAEIMRRRPLQKVFSPETILIQSQGMGTWLQQRLSEDLGIAALIDTQMPASFVWGLAERLLPDDQLIPLFEKQNLRWHIMECLPSKLGLPEYKPLAAYLEDESSTGTYDASRLFDLSEQLADLFDAYQNYRPDWLFAWENGQCPLKESYETGLVHTLALWQADLWKSLYNSVAKEARRHRPVVLDILGQTLLSLPESKKSLFPERLFIFGLSALPAQWLSLFEHLSRHIEIHFLALNPCQQYWGDIQSEPQHLAFQKTLIEQGISPETAAESVYEVNPLLASWGRLGRDYVALIAQSTAVNEISVDLYEEPSTETALGCVQRDILHLSKTQVAIDEADESLRFAKCHSRLREVEALHDHLLALLDQEQALLPKDIIVMMPDVQDFAALIESVFSRPVLDNHGHEHVLPFGISDQAIALDQPIIEVINDLFKLPTLRISVREVLDWLDIPAVRSRFDIEESELPLLHDWVKALDVRWGLSEQHKNRVLNSSQSSPMSTWASALRRVISATYYPNLSMATNLEENDPVVSDAQGDVLPFHLNDKAEQVLAGKLIRFLDVIEETLEQFAGEKPVDQWLQLIPVIWQAWFDAETLNEAVKLTMDQTVTSVREQILVSGFDGDIGLDIAAKAISTQFEKERVSQRFLAGRINFCTLMPMRSIPFKVVCLLGMNEGDYPRQETKMSFDLMSLTPGRLGDRSRRSDDRYLFLEALCSAREHLYISYSAYDARDNSERFPSLLVSELRDYCQANFSLKESDESVLEHWTIEHRLQPFHPAYYAGQTEPSVLPGSYCLDWLSLHLQRERERDRDRERDLDRDPDSIQIDQSIATLEAKTELASPDAISIEDIVTWANHPLRYYYQQHLGLKFFALEEELEEVEPFALTHLDLYQFRQELALNWQDDNRDSADMRQQWQLSDRLPHETVAKLYLDGLQSEVDAYQDRISEYAPFSTQSVDLAFQGDKLEGQLVLGQGTQIIFTLNKNAAGLFFGAWVKHLIWNVLDTNDGGTALPSLRTTTLVSSENNYVFDALDKVEAERYLSDILSWFKAAKASPCYLLPKTAFATLFGTAATVNTAFRGWRSSQNSANGEMADPYWQRVCFAGEETMDWEEIPSFEGIVIYDQVAEQLEKEQIVKVEVELK